MLWCLLPRKRLVAVSGKAVLDDLEVVEMKKAFGKVSLHKATGCWFCRIAGKQTYLTGANGTEEQAYAKLEELKKGSLVRTRTAEENYKYTPLYALISYFKDNYTKPCTERRIKDRNEYLDRFLLKFGQVTLSALEPCQIEQYAHGQKMWGTGSRENFYKCLSCAFNFLVKNDRITRNPVKAIDRVTPPIRSAEYLLSLEEHQAILGATKAHYGAIFSILWETGARPSEILNLEGRECNLAHNKITKAKHKTSGKGKTRIIRLTARAKEILADAIAKHGDGLLFPSARGKVMSRTLLAREFRKVAKKLTIKHKCSPYSYRHSFAVRRLQAGELMQDVATLLGNNVSVFEKHYAHFLESLDKRYDLLK
jgi:integrase/recombinase XerD